MQESEFEALALDVFRFQVANNPLYQQYVQMSGVSPEKVGHWTSIPFLPIELFKSHQVLTGSLPVLFSFESSGTTGQIPSKHPVCDPGFYQQISTIAFEREYGPLSDYFCLAAILFRALYFLACLHDGSFHQGIRLRVIWILFESICFAGGCFAHRVSDR
jgi:hypothetical protein